MSTSDNRSKFNSKNKNSNCQCQIQNQHEKYIQMSTNKPSIGPLVLEIPLKFWENIAKFQLSSQKPLKSACIVLTLMLTRCMHPRYLHLAHNFSVTCERTYNYVAYMTDWSRSFSDQRTIIMLIYISKCRLSFNKTVKFYTFLFFCLFFVCLFVCLFVFLF